MIVINSLNVTITAKINGEDQRVFNKNDNIEIHCDTGIPANEILTKLVMKFQKNVGKVTEFYNYTSNKENKVNMTNIEDCVVNGPEFKNGMGQITIVKANSTKLEGKYTCDVYTNKTTNSSSIELKFWDGKIELPKFVVRNNDDKGAEIKEIKKGEAFIVDCQANIAGENSEFNVTIKHKDTQIDKFDPKKKIHELNQKDGIEVKNLTETSAKLRVTDKDKKAQGEYSCEYNVKISKVGDYKISTKGSLKVNAGITMNLSLSLIVISLISLLYNFSKWTA